VPPKTLEERLALLDECGLKLASPFKIKDLFTLMDRSDYEEPELDNVVFGLACEEEKEPFRPFCRNLWHFDTECIEDNGDYAHIAKRISELTQGSLPIENIQDHIDIDKGEAWLAFSINGKHYKYNCKVDDDWVDTEIFSQFVELLDQYDRSKTFICYDLGGQDIIIGCVTKEQFIKLKSLGVNFQPNL